MKFIKLDLLTLLISLFLFASCENSSTIGLEVDPSIAVQGALVDTITISSRTLKDDITSTVTAARFPMGFLKDPIFGTTESSLAMAVNLPVDAYNFGTTPVVDSAILVLKYGGQFYGDSTANYSIDVHQLNVNISRETSFLSDRDWSYSTLLGNKTGKLRPTTAYKVTDVVAGKADTLRTVSPQIRIPLDKTFIQENIVNISAENLKYNANFTRFFNGLHVQINKTNSTGNGGIMFFDFGSASSSLVLYYKKANVSTGLKDTVSIDFPIVASTNPVAATIKHDYTGTPVATQLSNPSIQYPVTYLQPLSGLRNKISFPYLSKFAASTGKIVVNKAELVIDLSSGSDAIPYNAAPRLALYRYDIAEKRQNLPDNNAGSSTSSPDPRYSGTFGGYYNVLTKQYIFNVSAYVQDLLDGKTIDYGTFLAATPSTEFEVFPSIATASRAVIGSYKKNPVAGDNLMKLNIYYTKIN
ncbi:DUF4270 domain-containing protein [Pedobacter frigiditerrae]|uniref:DUF4270 domain-containing protein n=1 Tax=Pedobacter frigiditerrae TaxID=2530452 RepID=A0A4R0N1C4_9SPHI|nr:DUF4270 domain-containing protein [Pedobacter frigiditerrae]TCC93551.1 DUF4270 domain-containing protein [Pedobacter frigiditerrae]